MCCIWGKQVNISMVVDDAEAESLVIQLHKVFFPELESDANKVIVKGILQWNLQSIWLLVAALCVAWSNKLQICFIWFKAACFTLIMNWTGSVSHGTFARWRELLGLYLHTKSAAYVRFLNLQAVLVNHFSIGHWPSSNGEYPPSSRLKQWSAWCQVHGCRLMEVYLSN
jgi:hypothetical protein